MPIKLLPCPFCDASTVVVSHIEDDLDITFVCCHGCGADGPYNFHRSETEAADGWNKRSVRRPIKHLKRRK